jgi:hypothetical protein
MMSLGSATSRKGVGRAAQSSFPAVREAIAAVKELVRAIAWNFEADKMLTGEDGLATFATVHA